MPRLAVPDTTQDPGSATVRELCDHWQISEDTARSIVARHGLLPIDRGRQRYRWTDVWRVEGEGWVPSWDWPAYRTPLLRPTELPALDPHGRSDRTFRRLLAAGRIPSIVLSPGVRRVRPCLFERVVKRHEELARGAT